MGLLGNLFRGDPEKARWEQRKRELQNVLRLLREEEGKLALLLHDLDEQRRVEQRLLEEGKNEASESTRRSLAYRIRSSREKQRSLEERVEILERRVRIFREQARSLETLVEAGAGGLPNEQEIERAALEAARKREQLDELLGQVGSIRPAAEPKDQDRDDVESILREFDRRADREVKRAEGERPALGETEG